MDVSEKVRAVEQAKAAVEAADQECARAWVETGEVGLEVYAAYAEARMRHQAAVDALPPAEFAVQVPF